jgi:LDH2 family malate/lactate/ureidoglycolate dehydrogenase
MGGHKGYGLSIFCEIFAGALSGRHDYLSVCVTTRESASAHVQSVAC